MLRTLDTFYALPRAMSWISLVVLKHRYISRMVVLLKSWGTAILKAVILKHLFSCLLNLWKNNFPESSWCSDSPHFSVSRSKGLAPGCGHRLDGSVQLLILCWQLRYEISLYFYSLPCCMQHTGIINLIQEPWPL